MSENIRENHIVKDEEPEPSQCEGKRARKNRLLQKRTKTGCMTCRHRRVKCDEQHPICKKCIKSRRTCVWFPPEHPSNALQNAPPNLQHAGFFQPQMSLPYRIYDSTYAPNLTNFTAFAPNTIPNSMLQHPLNQFSGVSLGHDPAPYNHEYAAASMYTQSNQWHAHHGSWVHTYPNSLQQSYQTGMDPELYVGAFTAHSGMPPVTETMARQPDGTSQSVGTPAITESSTANADMRKSTLRRNHSEITSADSSEHSLPQDLRQHLSRDSSFQDQASSQDLQYLSREVETPDDSSEYSSEDISAEDSALINLRSAQVLAIDERKAYLLRHFVNNIRPCLSISEPSLKFDGSSSWGEILPSLALNCPGLLHGIMAASALHLAVLHGTSEVVPTKHFMIASKRLHKLLSAPSSRHRLQTLALCLLLSWYEVMNADHARWIMHLGGASSFLLEHVHVATVPPGSLSCEDSAIDEQLVEKLTGLEIKYNARTQQCARGTSRAAESEWKVRLDLFWWYIKMDVYHALLSGDQVLLPYRNWGLCPPRGKIGLIDQVHATIDYLWLVLGRLADFGGRDRLRKQRQIVATGGQWQPPPGFLHQPRREMAGESDESMSSTNHGRTQTTKIDTSTQSSKRGQPMNFYGMMPPPTIPPSMLSSFHINDAEMRKHSKPNEPVSRKSPNRDLATETQIALVEHRSIGDALEVWKQSLGRDFDNLPRTAVEVDSAFGPPLRYSDPLVACMWALYYLGRILLRRHHPHSPPAMIISAGVNAPFTQEDAQKIGRINAGLLENQAELAKAGSINPTLVAALQELSFVLMFAGVQYHNLEQRFSTVESLLDLARSSGWKSAYAVVSALETAWVAQSEMGKGPPYERNLDHDRSSHTWKNAGSSVSTSPGLQHCLQNDHESRFVSHDRGLITTYADARAYWAIGVLSSNDDIQNIFARSHVKDQIVVPRTIP